MARTKGSGWGGGPLLYQDCPNCFRRKAIYDPIVGTYNYMVFRCTRCKERFQSSELKRIKFRAELQNKCDHQNAYFVDGVGDEFCPDCEKWTNVCD